VFQVTANETATPNPFGDRTLSVSVLLIVTEEGRIVEYALETTFVEDGQRFHAQTRVQFRGRGRVSVDEPDWVPRNGTGTSRNGSRPADGAPVGSLDALTPGEDRHRFERAAWATRRLGPLD
jgi:hypothetical protein